MDRDMFPIRREKEVLPPADFKMTFRRSEFHSIVNE